MLKEFLLDFGNWMDATNLVLAVAVAVYTIKVDKNAKRHDAMLEKEEKRKLTIEAYKDLYTNCLIAFEDKGEPHQIKYEVQGYMKEAENRMMEKRETNPDYIYWPSRLEGMRDYEHIVSQIELFAACMCPVDGSEPIYDFETFAKIGAGYCNSKLISRLNSYFEAFWLTGCSTKEGGAFSYTNEKFKTESMKLFMEKVAQYAKK